MSTSTRTAKTKSTTAAVADQRKAKRKGVFNRNNWLEAACDCLIKGGIDRVKIERLSKEAGISRSSFYWNFSSRQDLLDALIDHWEATNTGPMLREIDRAIAEGPKGINRVTALWIEEKEFLPAYDTAIRGWARRDERVAKRLRSVDDKRIEALTRLLGMYGHELEEAAARARLMYYNQVGYYALEVRESKALRTSRIPLFLKILTGCNV